MERLLSDGSYRTFRWTPWEARSCSRLRVEKGSRQALLLHSWALIKARAFNMELLFRALADRTRLRLLNLMGDDEICVCFFVEIINTSQPKILCDLAYLRRAGG